MDGGALRQYCLGHEKGQKPSFLEQLAQSRWLWDDEAVKMYLPMTGKWYAARVPSHWAGTLQQALAKMGAVMGMGMCGCGKQRISLALTGDASEMLGHFGAFFAGLYAADPKKEYAEQAWRKAMGECVQAEAAMKAAREAARELRKLAKEAAQAALEGRGTREAEQAAWAALGEARVVQTTWAVEATRAAVQLTKVETAIEAGKMAAEQVEPLFVNTVRSKALEQVAAGGLDDRAAALKWVATTTASMKARGTAQWVTTAASMKAREAAIRMFMKN